MYNNCPYYTYHNTLTMAEEAPQVSYEELALIEHEFDEIDSEISMFRAPVALRIH